MGGKFVPTCKQIVGFFPSRNGGLLMGGLSIVGGDSVVKLLSNPYVKHTLLLLLLLLLGGVIILLLLLLFTIITIITITIV